MPNGEESRKQPFVVGGQQQWANDWVVAQHVEALWLYGENCVFTMLWRPQDEQAGRVGRCTHCYTNDRAAKAFKQPPSKKGCEFCYGTTFEGGIRAQIIRPAIFADRNSEMSDVQQGTVTTDSLQVETTPDFTFHRGDYIFRGDGTRYQAEELGEGVLRTGFGLPLSANSFRGSIPIARLEDLTSVAYTIPPDGPNLIALLDGALNSVDLTGSGTIPDSGGEQAFDFPTPAAVWDCEHVLGRRYLNVTLVDLEGSEMFGEVEFVSDTLTRITWYRPTAGRAVLKV